jgi:hypothetical protein
LLFVAAPGVHPAKPRRIAANIKLPVARKSVFVSLPAARRTVVAIDMLAKLTARLYFAPMTIAQ